MKARRNEHNKLPRRLMLIKLLLVLSFSAAVGTTLITISPSFMPSGHYEQIPGQTVQTTLQTTKATTASTTLFSYTATVTTIAGTQQGPVPSTTSFSIGPNLQQYSGLAALLSWTVFAGALIWRGHVRSVWGKSRFSYDTFRLLVRMRGAQTRMKLMRSLNEPKNKLQLSTALGIEWKAIDRHVQVLEKNGLIEATTTSGTAVFYEITEKGKRLLQVLEELSAETPQATA